MVDAEFGVFLGTAYKDSASFDFGAPKGCRYGDLLVLLMHKGLRQSHLVNSPLQQTFLSILYNVSPFLRELGPAPVEAILQLAAVYSDSRWLLRSEDSFTPLKLLLDAILHILTYKYESNAQLVMMLMRQTKQLFSLADSGFPHEEPLRRNEEEKSAAPAGWVPTAEWFSEQKTRLPLRPILRLISHAAQKVEQAYLIYNASEEAVLGLLRRTSVIGIQGDVGKFTFLRYASSPAIEDWLSGYLWKVTYMKNSPMFVPGHIRYIESGLASRAGRS